MKNYRIKVIYSTPIILLLTVAMSISCIPNFFHADLVTDNISDIDCSALFADKIGGYTTYFLDSTPARVHNIALAALKLNHTLVRPTQTISFNALVGERTPQRGFQNANIILDGEFKDGIGGGICQVSSTLYNAWVTSGLEVVSAKAHSMPVNYIPMSRDATVSTYIDLLLKNNSPHPVLINTKCENNAIAISILGKNNGYEYNVITSVVRELPPALPEIIYDIAYPPTHEELIKIPRVGYITLATIQTLKGGKVLESKTLREDTYQPIRGKIVRGGTCPTPEFPLI